MEKEVVASGENIDVLPNIAIGGWEKRIILISRMTTVKLCRTSRKNGLFVKKRNLT